MNNIIYDTSYIIFVQIHYNWPEMCTSEINQITKNDSRYMSSYTKIPTIEETGKILAK